MMYVSYKLFEWRETWKVLPRRAAVMKCNTNTKPLKTTPGLYI